MTTIYVTKGCLTSGAVKKTEVNATSEPGMYTLKVSAYPVYFHRNDYCFSEEDALKKAKIMRDREVIRLKAKIEKLESCTFGVAK